MDTVAKIAEANRAKAACRARRLDHYRGKDRERKARARAANPERVRAHDRSTQNRRAAKLAWFLRATTHKALTQTTEYQRGGSSIVTTRQLARPLFIFELNGARRYEHWPAQVS